MNNSETGQSTLSAGKPQNGWWLWNKNLLAFMLWPLSLVFCLLVTIRRQCYQRQWLKSYSIDKPVIIVGNISVGGNGKTPIVQSLVKLLKSKGYQPGIITRGYKSDVESGIVVLTHSENSNIAGDEANMLSELCACPIGIGADRVKAAKVLLEQFPALDLLIADDGLQHYALARDIEIIVKREQALGNGYCLPAGPLREPRSRLQECDLLIDRDTTQVSEQFGLCWNLMEPQQTRELNSFSGQKIHALAGIGFPHLFFNALLGMGLEVITHSFPDHHTFQAKDITTLSDSPLLVTHKDAVKIRQFATDNIWVVPLELSLSDDLQYQFLTALESKFHG